MGAKIRVFLSHNSADKPAVETLAIRLHQEADIEPWLDKWSLTPGEAWQEELERAISTCDVCAIFVGPNGPGAWHHEEMRALINRRVSDRQGHFRVIPVLLPGAERSSRSSLPTFLVATTWVEFRRTLDDPEAYQQLLFGILGKKPGPPVAGHVFLAQCPYRGLEFFDVPQADYFFGREAVTQWLVDDVRKLLRSGSDLPRFLVILGASGSGKSSLGRAGLYATLRAGAIEGSRDWIFVPPLRPGPNPLESLDLAMIQTAAGSRQLEAVRHEIHDVKGQPHSLHRAARLLIMDGSPSRRLFLLVDQFEELFTLCEKEELRASFIAALLHAARERGGPVVVVLTMRADFYPKVAVYEELARVMDQHQFLLGPMTEAELRLAIEEPAIRVGAEFEPGLVETLLEDVHRQPGALPLLQHALLELWNRREDGRRLTHAAYEAIGKLEGALERRANEIFKQLNPEDQELSRRVFLRLVHLGEGAEDTKRRVRLRELLALGESARIQKLIQNLAAPESRLMVTEGGDTQEPSGFVEVAHEILIRSWSLLRKWLDADRAGLRIHRRLTEAAEDWDRAGKPKEASALYSGARLATAREWADRHPDDLSKLESEFLEASAAVEVDASQAELRQQRERAETLDRLAKEQQRAADLERQKAEVANHLREEADARAQDNAVAASRANRQSKIVSAVALLAVIFAVIASFFYSRASKESLAAKNSRAVAEGKAREATNALAAAERSAALSQAQALIVEANQVRARYPLQSLLLASAASETVRQKLPEAPMPSAVLQSLRDGLTEVGGRSLVGHTSSITSVAISPDGRWLATGSDDKTARLWNLQTPDPAAQPLLLKGHESFVLAVAFSPDNRWLVTGSMDQTARLWNLQTPDPAAQPLVLKGHESYVWAVAFSPDNRWLVTGSGDKTARLWNLQTADPAAQPLLLKGHESDVLAVAFSPDNHWLVTGSRDETARLWNLQTADPAAQPLLLKGHESTVRAVAFSPDNRWLVTASEDQTARLWNLQTADPAAQPLLLKGHIASVLAVAFSPDNRWLVTGSQDLTARLWNLQTADPAAQPLLLKGHESDVGAVAFSPDNRWLVTGSGDKTARLWNLQTVHPAAQPLLLKGHESDVGAMAFSAAAVAFSPDNRWLVTGSGDKTARLWNLQTVDPAAQPLLLKGHESDVLAVAFSPDNRWLVTGGRDKTARLWNLQTADPAAQPLLLKGHESYVWAVAFSPDNRWLVTGGRDKIARLWNLQTVDPAAQPLLLKGHESDVRAVAFSPDNRWLVTGSGDKTARLWNLQTVDPAAQPLLLKGHESDVLAVAFSPDNRWLVTGSRDETARLWNLQTADPAAQPLLLKGHESDVVAVAFSPDNRWLVTGSRTARLWNLQTADPAAQPLLLKGHVSDVLAVAFSPDNRWLVTGSRDETARLWNLQTADPAAQPLLLKGHESDVVAVAFSPDNRWLVTGSRDKTARLWNLQTADPAAQPLLLKGLESDVVAVAFSPDNRWLVTGSDETARLWLLQVKDLITLARRTVGRNLSTNEWQKVLPAQPYFQVFPDLPIPTN